MDDYPINLMEFDRRFQSEQACRAYLAQIRWPDGFHCPYCGNGQAWMTSRNLYHCTVCRHDTSLTAGTVFQDTRKPLMMWFRAMWFVTSQKNGASAMGLKDALGLGSYQTAWTWLHKLRRAMIRPGRDRLRGKIELDETYVGGPEEGLRGRKIEDKALVLIAVEREGNHWARTRMRVIENFCSETILKFVRDSIEPGSVIRTDGLNSYLVLPLEGYVHDRVVQSKSNAKGSEVLPGVHRVAALLKRWLLGTHQGAVSPQHLNYYGRICFSVQSTQISPPRQAVLPIDAASRGDGANALSPDRRAAREKTICRARLSQVDTHFILCEHPLKPSV